MIGKFVSIYLLSKLKIRLNCYRQMMNNVAGIRALSAQEIKNELK